jgi:acetyltransferase-like isoleucine patch superfamily enzyme
MLIARRSKIGTLIPRRLLVFAARLKHRGTLEIGKNSYVHRRCQIIGRSNVSIGTNTCISQNCWLNVNHRAKGVIGIRIGSNCFIGRDNFFSSGRSIELADYCLTTLGCRFICSTHRADDPSRPYVTAHTTDTDRIVVGPNCFFGVGATVLGNVSIGHGSIVGANSLVTCDIPPFSMAVGSPAKVIKRYSFTKATWIHSEMLESSDLDANPGENDYLAELRANSPTVIIPWLAAGTNFGSL